MPKAVRSAAFAVVSFLCLLSAVPLSAQVSLTALGTPVTQNFDTLATSGTSNAWTDNTTLPGWYAQFTAVTTNPTVYIADTGTSTTGGIHSYGVAGVNALTERAFGSVGSGTPGTIYYGVRLLNNSGTAITSFNISYNGEQWRNGGNTTAQKLDFQYQIANATTITDANTPTTGWVDYDPLDFTGPQALATAAALDGNAAANRTSLSSTLTVTVNAGQEIWLRWKDVDDTGSDHGLAIDDLSVTPFGAAANNPPAITPPANPAATVTKNASPFPVTIHGSDDGGMYNWSASQGSGVSSVSVTSGQGTSSVTYTVTLATDFTGTATFTASLSDNFNPPVTQAVNIQVNAPTPPAAPSGVTATPGNAHVQLTWNAVSGATSYNVKRGTTAGGPYSTINSPSTNSYDDTSAVNGTAYYYVVSAVGAGGEGANSSEVSATPQAEPTAPAGLTAAAGDSHVSLSWTASPAANTYTVARGTAPGGPYGTTFAGLVTTSYNDTTAVNGTTYYYVVTATNGFGTSANSNEASATPAPLVAPTGFAAQVGDATVTLTWNAVAGATTYDVKRSTTAGGPYTTVGTPSGTTFTDSSVANATSYYYVVAAFSGSDGPMSAEVGATPNTPSVLGVVISQVYGGGGNAGATLKNDYVELFNRGTQTISLNGWYVHYSSATATTWNSPVGAATTPTALSGSIPPGHYYLVQESPGANGSAANLPTPDATGTLALSATAGKVALTDTATIGVQCPSGGSVADFVGYGGANCSESSPTPVLTNTSAAVRNSNGCTDTNNNASDFSVVAQPLNPRTSSSGSNSCNIINNPPTITPPANPIASVAQDAAPFTVQLSGNDDGGVYTWSATTGTGVQNVSVSNGQNTPNVTYTVTLVAGFNGTATFTATLFDGINPAVNQAVHIQVTAAGSNNPPVITPPANPITTVAQDPPPFTVDLSGTDDGGIFNWTATPGTGVASVNVTGGQGTGTVTYTVALNAGFNGTATFTATLSDNANPPVNQAVNINVLSAGSTPNHVVISQLYGGGGNSGATFTNDYIELFNPTASPVNMASWSVQYSPATNTGAFTGLQPIGGTIGPGEYFLISLASGGATGSALPTANIVNNSGFNMSGTAGKVALVSTGNVVGGPCSTTQADTDIVDLVGYGTTSNCNEGGTNAPAPSNTTADFRKAGGNTDTNVNGNDFITATPNPRRTSPIQETGPSIVNTDPTSNGVNAPRDASIIVTFTELVDVTSGWYNINCSSSGVHNDATVVEGAPDTWVITPNVNFVPAEQCSVTIFKDFVHDRDTDDSVPGTDTLPADYTWTFTVATGTAPPYPADVHLTMGNPSNATASLSNPNNYLMEKAEMAISYNRDLGRPNWVSWHLSDEWTGSLARVDTFRPDPAVPPDWYRVLASDFFASGFDRGHMCPNADRDKETSIPINQATFLMSNMVAQSPDNNQGPWAALESYLRSLLPADEIYIVSGPAGSGGSGSNGGTTTTLANGHVTVPASTWKCALVLPKASGDDLARVTASTRTVCVIMPNIQGIRNDDWHLYLKSVDQVETLSGFDLFSNVPPAIQNAIEAGVDGNNPPGTAGQSTSTNEDVQKSITLDAASPSGALTYTIVSGPSHGSLTGSGSSRTYTPAPDYNGSDSFTFRVNDGSHDSNTSTVSITINEVNDAPVAIDDSKTMTQGDTLTFSATDLSANDSAGPANESAQTLTVSSVTATASTHGTVSLDSGQVSYTPATNYSGPASFTYSVCDNGLTAGASDSQCSTATVNVTINAIICPPVTDPTASNSGPACEGSSVNLFATGSGSFSWTGPGGFTSSQQNPTGITVAGTYTVTVSTTGPCAHSSSASTTVVINAIPVATITAANAACASSTGNAASVADAGAGATYTWSITNGSITAGSGTRSISFTAAASGSVHLAVTVSNNGCSDSGSADVAINAVPVATITAANATCSSSTGNAASVADAGAGATYTWSITNGSITAGDGTRSITFTAGASGSVRLAVTVSNNGCSDSGSADVAINAVPVATITAANATCASSTGNAASVADVGAGATYTWSITNGSITAGDGTRSITFTAGASGSVHLAVTVSNNGCSDSGSSDVAINAVPVATITAANATCASSTGNAASVADAGAGATYTWSITNGSITAGSGTRSVTYAAGSSGSVHLAVTVSNNGCSDSGSADVAINAVPVATITAANATCSSSTGNAASVADAGAGAAYAWSITNGSITAGSGTRSITFTAGASGSVHLAVTVSNNGCSDSGSADVAINAVPVATITAANATCASSTGNAASVADAGAGATYTWSITNGSITAGDGTRSVTYAAGSSGSVHLAVTVSNNGCADSGSADVAINAVPVATISAANETCASSTGNAANVADAGAGATYTWSITNGSITAGSGTRSVTFTAGASGSVHLAVTVSNNGCSDTGSADVAIDAIPTITMASSINAGCAPTVVNVPFSLTGTGPWTVHWSDGVTQSGIVSSSSSRNVTVNASMVLSVTSVTDAHCTNASPAASVTITATNPPAITTQPVSQVVNKGAQATFTVSASGQSLHYQWFTKRPNGTVAAVGTDSASYTTDPANNTSWFVRITNSCGTVDSVMVTATVSTRRHP
jgi:DNA/RNA endonuclease G (NUC1)/fibronectin type 3 domain-containing protein